jgi:hypothetical protein
LLKTLHTTIEPQFSKLQTSDAHKITDAICLKLSERNAFAPEDEILSSKAVILTVYSSSMKFASLFYSICTSRARYIYVGTVDSDPVSKSHETQVNLSSRNSNIFEQKYEYFVAGECKLCLGTECDTHGRRVLAKVFLCLFSTVLHKIYIR